MKTAQVTEEHRKLAVELILGLPSRSYESATVHGAARLIADSEARATAAIRAEVERLKAVALALGMSCGELSCDECNNRTAALTTERDQLRAELARIDAEKPWLKEANATIAQLHAEVERLRSDRDCEKRLRKDAEELREDAIARADRAEAELAAERARLDWLESDAGVDWQWNDAGGGIVSRAKIDAAMKESK